MRSSVRTDRCRRNALRVLLISSAVFAAVVAQAQTLRPAGESGVVFERRFFGIHLHQPERTPWPAARFGTWRLWDTGISWADMEPRPEQYDFAKLDRHLDLAERNKVEVVLPIAMTPAWASSRPTERSPYKPGGSAPPADPAMWKRFVEKLVKHTRGRVRAYELWNEANIPMFYTGNIETLVDMAKVLHDAVKAHAPASLVVAPSGAGLLDPRRQFVANFLAAGGGKWIDVLSFHLYTGPHGPEVMLKPVAELMAVAKAAGASGLPLWNTESGYQVRPERALRGSKHQDAQPVERAAAYVVRAHLIARALGVTQFDAYAWDNGNYPFTLDDRATLSPVGSAYVAMTSLLVGTTLKECTIARASASVCNLSSPAFGAFRVAWSAADSPVEWRAGGRVKVSGLDGTVVDESAETVQLSAMPVVITPLGVSVPSPR